MRETKPPNVCVGVGLDYNICLLEISETTNEVLGAVLVSSFPPSTARRTSTDGLGSVQNGAAVKRSDNWRGVSLI